MNTRFTMWMGVGPNTCIIRLAGRESAAEVLRCYQVRRVERARGVRRFFLQEPNTDRRALLAVVRET